MLTDFSTQMADVVAGAAPSIVQVQGRRRPATGIVYGADVVVTTMRALGREDGLRVRQHEGRAFDAELAGWDPATSVAVLRVPGLQGSVLSPTTVQARVGNLALAVARSCSNALTASAGIGPSSADRCRRTRRAIDQVSGPRRRCTMIRWCAFLEPRRLLGVGRRPKSAVGVIIPSAIAWKAAAAVLEHGGMKRGYLGIAGQPVTLPEAQRTDADHGDDALLVTAVTAASPAARAGLLVGDLILALDGHPIESPEDLLDLLVGDRVGHEARVRVLRGGTPRDIVVTVGERPGVTREPVRYSHRRG